MKDRFYYEYWLPLQARVDAIGHWLQGHRLVWRWGYDPWTGVSSICCLCCPETSDGQSDLAIWTRHNRSWHAVARVVCGVLGHPEWRHPTRGLDDTPVLEEQYCYRCMADRKTP